MSIKKLVAFACENSSYLAAEAATDKEVLDLVDVIRVPCSGRIEIGMVLKCLENDHPGVLVLGCPLDNCKFIRGSARADKRISMAKKALRDAGVNEDRLHMDFIASVDSNKFETVVREMHKRLVEYQRSSP